jgi:hypothetical protein
MPEITSKYIKEELIRIASFLLEADQFQGMGPTNRRYLLGLEDQYGADNGDLKWSQDTSDGDSFDEREDLIEIEGVFNGKRIELKVDKRNKKTEYTLLYEGEDPSFTNLKEIESHLNDFLKGDETISSIFTKSYKLIKDNKRKLEKHIKEKYLTQVAGKPEDWTMNLDKAGVGSDFKIKFSARLNEDQDKDEIKDRFYGRYTNGQNSRLQNIKNHIKIFLKDNDVNVDRLDFSEGWSNSSNKVELILTSKPA